MRDGGVKEAFENLVRWAQRSEWLPHLTEVMDNHFELVRFSKREIFDSLKDIEGAQAALYCFIFEDFCTQGFGENFDSYVIDDYLARRGWRESPRARRYLESLRDSTASLFEVVSVDRGRSLEVRDLLRGGEPITVSERSASKSLAPWERIGGRIVTLDGRNEFSSGMLHYRFGWAANAQARFENFASEMRKRSILTRKALLASRWGRTASPAVPPITKEAVIRRLPCTGILSEFWMEDMQDRIHTGPPEVFNSDGERLVLCELRFPMSGKEASIAKLLDEIAGFDRVAGREGRWVWFGPGSATQPPARNRGETPPAPRESNRLRTVLGHVSAEAGLLTLRVNSVERTERGRSLLSAKLGDLVGQPQTVTHDAQQALAGSTGGPSPDGPPAEEELQAIRQVLDLHYRRKLDEPLPVFGGRRLRDMVRSTKGREEAVGWLKELEIHEYRRAAAQGCDPYDTRWIWRELGLERLR